MSQWQPRYDPRAHGYGQPGYRQPDPRDGRQQQPYAGQWPPQQQPEFQRQPPPRRKRSGARVIFGALCGLAVIIVIAIAASRGSSPQQTPAAASLPAASTITFVTSGSEAQVTYGDAGSSLAGKVPMHVTGPLGNPLYYSIQAQLQGSGSVSCKILINGTVISQATASGGYNIAMCEVSKDPLSGQWQDTNTGA